MKRRSGRTYDEVTDSARSEAGGGDENTADLKPQTRLTSGNKIIKLHMMRQKMFKPNVHAMIWVYESDCKLIVGHTFHQYCYIIYRVQIYDCHCIIETELSKLGLVPEVINLALPQASFCEFGLFVFLNIDL